MNNYVYIIAGLPDLTPDWRQGSLTIEEYLDEIKSLCSAKDNKAIEFIERGFDKDQIGFDFYKEAESQKDRFLREYFLFDLNVRNTKVKYLNKALSRDGMKDVISLYVPGENDLEAPEAPEFKEEQKLQTILEGKDILVRERQIDDLYWDKIDELTLFDYLTFDAILGVVVKMHIILRWLKLDEKTGREMFRRLVDEVRGTFKGVDYKEEK